MQRERRGRRANGSDPSLSSSPPATDVTLEGLADYDKAMTEIDDIIARLEDGQHSLDEEMRLYERAMRLAHACDQLLRNAELRVEKLRSDLSAGEASFALEDFDIDDE
jgi:exodeoxyribonuclease VII small subunit